MRKPKLVNDFGADPSKSLLLQELHEDRTGVFEQTAEQPTRMKILLIGVDFYPVVKTTDKNFWLSLVKKLEPRFERIEIMTFTTWDSQMVESHIGSNIHFVYRRFLPYLSANSVISGFVVRSLSPLYYLRLIRRIVKSSGVQVIHFIDNFGLAMPMISVLCPKVMVTASVQTPRPKRRIYDFFIGMSYKHLDRVSCSNDALKERLIEAGIKDTRVSVIRWGVTAGVLPKATSLSQHNQEPKVVLWSGFLASLVEEEDFLFAIAVARKVIEVTKKYRFVFIFKPYCFKPEYRQYEQAGIAVQPAGATYEAMMSKADLFFCPIKNKSKFIIPPLTWIEMLAAGKPIITTVASGVEEVIINEENGFVCRDEQSLVDTMLKVADDESIGPALSQGAVEWAMRRFSLSTTAAEYKAMWERSAKKI